MLVTQRSQNFNSFWKFFDGFLRTHSPRKFFEVHILQHDQNFPFYYFFASIIIIKKPLYFTQLNFNVEIIETTNDWMFNFNGSITCLKFAYTSEGKSDCPSLPVLARYSFVCIIAWLWDDLAKILQAKFQNSLPYNYNWNIKGGNWNN